MPSIYPFIYHNFVIGEGVVDEYKPVWHVEAHVLVLLKIVALWYCLHHAVVQTPIGPLHHDQFSRLWHSELGEGMLEELEGEHVCVFGVLGCVCRLVVERDLTYLRDEYT